MSRLLSCELGHRRAITVHLFDSAEETFFAVMQRGCYCHCCRNAPSVQDEMSRVVKPDQPPKREQSRMMEGSISNESEHETSGDSGCGCVWGGWAAGSSEPFPASSHFKETTWAPGVQNPWDSDPEEDSGGRVPLTCQEAGGMSLLLEVLTFAKLLN